MKALKFVSHAMGVSDIRPYLNGVLFEFRALTGLTLVATDGHRLAVAELDADVDFTGDFIVSAASVKQMLALFRKDGPRVYSATETGFALSDGVDRIEPELIDGKFPEYRRVIPGGTPTGNAIQHFESRFLAQAFTAIGILLPKSDVVRVKRWDENAVILIEAPAMPRDGVLSARVIVMSAKGSK